MFGFLFGAVIGFFVGKAYSANRQNVAGASHAASRTQEISDRSPTAPGDFAAEVPPPPTKTQSTDLLDISLPKVSLDSVNMLLFAGAFTIVVSALYFVGADQFDLSGWTKFLILAVLAWGFYICGVLLGRLDKKFRPASLTFIAIGIAVIPLLSFAYRNFINPDISVEASLLVASVMLVAISGASYLFSAGMVLDYVFMLAVVATVQSGALLADLSVHEHVWVGLVSAIALMIYSQVFTKQMNGFLSASSKNFAYMVAGAFTLVAMLSQPEHTWMYGVSFGLVWLFSFASLLLEENADHKEAMFYVSLSSPILVALTITQTGVSYDYLRAAYTMISLILLYVSLDSSKLRDRLPTQQQTGLSSAHFVGSLTLVFLLVAHESRLIALPIIVMAVYEAYMYIVTRRKQYAVYAVGLLPLLPLGLLNNNLEESTALAVSSLYYLSLTIYSLAVRWLLEPKLSDFIKQLARVAYSGFLTLSYVLALFAADGFSVAISLVAIACVLAIGRVEKDAQVRLLTLPLMYVSAALIVYRTGLTDELYWLPFAAASVIQKLYPIINRSEPNRNMWHAGSLFGASIATSLALYQSSLTAGLLLAFMSLLSIVWATAFKERFTLYLGFAKMALAISFIAYHLDFRHVLIYSVIWAASLLVVARYESRSGSKEAMEMVDVAALFALTVPLSISVMFGRADQIDGLYLLLINLVIFFTGLAIRYRNVAIWGLVMLLANVVWQTRDYISAIPKQLIGFGLGLGLVGLAIYLIMKSSSRD
ncbi:MAG: hypothetical protein AAF413_02950 [Patescibacteria group bacterium]